jgi:hypothetical protein
MTAMRKVMDAPVFARNQRSERFASNKTVAELQAMTRRLAAWRLHELETTSPGEIHSAATSMAKNLLETAVALFGHVLQSVQMPVRQASGADEWGEYSEEPEVFLGRVDRTIEVFSTVASADIAFIAKLEMQSLARELESLLPTSDGWKVIELCERIRRHIVKATIALRRTLGQELAVALPGDEIYVSELVRSIQVRRRLALFRRRVQETKTIRSHALDLRLRLVGTNIAMLICRAEYRDFRTGDRVLIRDIQQRILEFLRQPTRPEVTGQRLWRDVMGALEITRQINRRPELLEHDCLVLEALHTQLQKAPRGEISDDVLERARAVFGREDTLDDLILQGAPIDAERWGAAVVTAMTTLEQHKAPQSAVEEILEASARSRVRPRVEGSEASAQC